MQARRFMVLAWAWTMNIRISPACAISKSHIREVMLMPLAVIPDIEGGTLEKQVTVTGVESDGRFHIKSEDGLAMGWCNPEKVLLFENGVQVEPTVTPPEQEVTPELLEALMILLGGE
jgi:hypothetical protein